jgi:ADP-ribose pyrophosphatase YjhB (NUDIX family)
MVASQYPNQPEPLWHLPGGRARPGELLRDALTREFAEETALVVSVGRLLYVAESFDRSGGVHVISATFSVQASGTPHAPAHDAHVVDIAWMPRERALERIAPSVIREPLAAYFRGDETRYHAFADAGITIAFADDP